MRHRKLGRKLGVKTKHRKSLFRNLITDLFRHGKIKTTDPKAKELRRVAEKYITLSKKGTLHARRMAAAFIRDKDVLKKLFGELAERFKERPGGYTRIIKLGVRTGDNAPISLVELLEETYKPKKKKTKSAAKKKQTITDSPKAKSTKKESAQELGLAESEDEKNGEKLDAKVDSKEETTSETTQEHIIAEDTSDTDEIKAEDDIKDIESANEPEKIVTEPETKEEVKSKEKVESTGDSTTEDKSEEEVESETPSEPEVKEDVVQEDAGQAVEEPQAQSAEEQDVQSDTDKTEQQTVEDSDKKE